MKPFVFNKDSWHYWLATEMSGFDKYRTETDICSYTRDVIKGAFWTTAAFAAVCAMLFWVTVTVVWWVVVLQYGFFHADGPVVLTAILTIFGTSALIAEGVPWLYRKAQRKLYDSRQGNREKVKTDTFITEAYRSWKAKTCVRVTLIEDTPNE
jgi:hypothetical protein